MIFENLYLKIYIPHGSAATQLRCGAIFNNHIIANCPQSVPGKKFKSRNIWQRYGQSLVARFFMADGAD